MSKNSQSKIALWVALGVALTAGAVALLVLALLSPSDEGGQSGTAPSTSRYTTTPAAPTQEPSGQSAPPTPVTVVTQTVIAVPSDGGDGGDAGTLISALGSLLSGAAAVGTLLHAVHLSRQNRPASS
ncbi:hypothetical protein [Streptomyces chartreusis]|uniref:hypothetical protein n=1 Tax=Streptomyces chartreusis TaxID=1969 RepID=UPI002E1803D0